MDWNSKITKDSGTVKDGEYPYLIVDAEQKRTKETLKPMLEVCAKIGLEQGREMELRDWIVLSEETEWKVGQFLVSIGQKERGKECIPDWSPNAIIGKRGRLKVKNRNDRSQITWLAPQKDTDKAPKEAKEEKQDDFFKDFEEVSIDDCIPF